MPIVYFATNRNPNRKTDPDDFDGRFNAESVDSLRFGRADVQRSADGYEVTAVHVAPERLRQDQAKSLLGSANVFEELRDRMRQGRDALAFIHGYNVDFREALVTGARLADAYGPDLEVVVFSWPSDGSMLPFLAYKRDRTDAAASAPAFARALLKLRDFVHEVRRGDECGSRLHLMAHSMGNYVLRHGIQEVLRHGSIPRVFDQVFLMAADEDDDAFELDHKLRPLPHLGQGVHVYFNRGDTALVISDRTKANPTRLGSRGPREPLNVPASVTIVDVSEVVGGMIEHDYLVRDPRTVRDVSAVLAGEPNDLIAGRRYVASQNRYVLEK
ncbi:MAG: alpha/beta hydrolase [Planctomycetota bacterium]